MFDIILGELAPLPPSPLPPSRPPTVRGYPPACFLSVCPIFAFAHLLFVHYSTLSDHCLCGSIFSPTLSCPPPHLPPPTLLFRLFLPSFPHSRPSPLHRPSTAFYHVYRSRLPSHFRAKRSWSPCKPSPARRTEEEGRKGGKGGWRRKIVWNRFDALVID